MANSNLARQSQYLMAIFGCFSNNHYEWQIDGIGKHLACSAAQRVKTNSLRHYKYNTSFEAPEISYHIGNMDSQRSRNDVPLARSGRLIRILDGIHFTIL